MLLAPIFFLVDKLLVVIC